MDAQHPTPPGQPATGKAARPDTPPAARLDLPPRSDAPVSDGVVIRRATTADIPLLFDLRMAMDRELGGGWTAEREAEHAALLQGHLEDAIPSGDLHAFLAESPNGTVIGTASVRVVHRSPSPRSRRPGECQVTAVYTCPDWRQRGVARALVQACVDEARALRVRRVWLRCSAAGRGVYTALGFADPGNSLQLDLN